jgi:hypothetical protein
MPKGVIMYLHGGAFTLGSCSYQLPTVAVVVATTGLPVVCVEYRLAPEHPFPAALDDIFAAYQGLLDQGYSADSILLVGDSAGGWVGGLVAKCWITAFAESRGAETCQAAPFMYAPQCVCSHSALDPLIAVTHIQSNPLSCTAPS